LERFIETVNNNGKSHLITVPEGTMVHLAEIVMDSPICMYLHPRIPSLLPSLSFFERRPSLSSLPFRSGFGDDAGVGGGRAPASTVSSQFEDDLQRALEVPFCWRFSFSLRFGFSSCPLSISHFEI
jgi:hypothetical protein